MNLMIKPINESDVNFLLSKIDFNKLPSCDQALASLIGASSIGDDGVWVNGQLAGLYDLKSKRSSRGTSSGHINYLYLLTEYRNNGTGSALLQFLKDNCSFEALSANPFTERSERFFQKMGFEVQPDFMSDDTNTVVWESRYPRG